MPPSNPGADGEVVHAQLLVFSTRGGGDGDATAGRLITISNVAGFAPAARQIFDGAHSEGIAHLVSGEQRSKGLRVDVCPEGGEKQIDCSTQRVPFVQVASSSHTSSAQLGPGTPFHPGGQSAGASPAHVRLP